MSISDRLKRLEQRPKPQRPHGMTQTGLALHMASLTPREQDAFIQTMTDDDLNASIEHLQNLEEQEHGNA